MQLGVGGYAFIVDNNGYILIHPDFRPVVSYARLQSIGEIISLLLQFYKDILKPAYNAVDMIEVELMEDDYEPRDFNPLLIQVNNVKIFSY